VTLACTTSALKGLKAFFLSNIRNIHICRYKNWADECAGLFDGLDILCVEIIHTKDDKEYIIEVRCLPLKKKQVSRNSCLIVVEGRTRDQISLYQPIVSILLPLKLAYVR